MQSDKDIIPELKSTIQQSRYQSNPFPVIQYPINIITDDPGNVAWVSKQEFSSHKSAASKKYLPVR